MIDGQAVADLPFLQRGAMADQQLTLTGEEQDFLISLLEATLKEVKIEEHRTKTLSYRERVIQKEDLLSSLLAKLDRPQPGR